MKRSEFLKLFGLTAISGAVIELQARNTKIIYPEDTIGYHVGKLEPEIQETLEPLREYYTNKVSCDYPFPISKPKDTSKHYIESMLYNALYIAAGSKFLDIYYNSRLYARSLN